MIRAIRKVPWLVAPIFIVVIISFVVFMAAGPTRSGSGYGSGGYNTNVIGGDIYGQKVTPDRYQEMQKEVDLNFLFEYGNWPEKNPNMTPAMLQEQIYLRMMMVQKAKELGVHVSDEQVAQETVRQLSSPGLLRAFDVHGDTVPFDGFLKQVLTPQGLTAVDFQNYIRDQLAIQQLQQLYGLFGELITPQEAMTEYVRQNQEFSAQIVFFSASNYVNQVTVNPQAVGEFYTNYMADYRYPDRVQVSYVLFSVTNYLADAEKTLVKSNLDQQVNALFNKYGSQAAPDAKTPDEAKAVIRKAVIRQEALGDANKDADVFAQAVFNVSNNGNKAPSPADLVSIAHQKGLTVQTPQPFSGQYGPQDFEAPSTFTRTAFELSPDSPISEPLMGPQGVFVIALDQQLPSEIPPLSEIRPKVARDYVLRVATLQAIRAGTNFVRSVNVEMASGKSFAAAAVADGFQPEMLPPFALSTQEIPELGDRAKINQIKQAAFSTPVGVPSGFVQTDEGGFVLCVQSRLPIDQSKMTADLREFTAQLREQRAQAAFNSWYLREANRELRTTPLGKSMSATK